MRKSRSDKAKAVCCCLQRDVLLHSLLVNGQWGDFSTVTWAAVRTTRHPHTGRVDVDSSRRLLTFRGRTWPCALAGLVSWRHSRGKQEYNQRVILCYLKICNTWHHTRKFRFQIYVYLLVLPRMSEVHDDGTDVLYLWYRWKHLLVTKNLNYFN
jgi:hypothetical protein